MEKLIYKKGYLLKVTSWENDGDNRKHLEHIVDTKEEALALQRLCKTLFVSHHNSLLGIANVFEEDLEQFSKYFYTFYENDEFYKSFSKEEILNSLEESIENLLGYSEYYSCRVCEKCEVFYIEKDIYLTLIES